MATFQFGGFRFDSAEGLTRDGRSVAAPPQALRALEVLLEAEGALVSRDALATGAWPGGNPSDVSIARVIYLLRRAMKGAGGEPVVETRYGTGFRVTAPVTRVRPGAAAVAERLGRTAHATVVEAYMTGRELIGARTPQDLAAALAVFQRVVEIDPEYVPAWEMIAECHVLQFVRWIVPPADGARHAREAVDRALRLDPRSSRALSCRGWLRGVIDGDRLGALADIEAALEIDGNASNAQAQRAWLEASMGNTHEAVAGLRRGIALDPISPRAHIRLALILSFAGEHEAALASAREATSLLATQGLIWATRAVAATRAGLFDEALDCGARAMQLCDAPAVESIHAYVLAASGRREEAERAIDHVHAHGSTPAFLALAEAALGREEDAQAALAAAKRSRCPWLGPMRNTLQ